MFATRDFIYNGYFDSKETLLCNGLFRKLFPEDIFRRMAELLHTFKGCIDCNGKYMQLNNLYKAICSSKDNL